MLSGLRPGDSHLQRQGCQEITIRHITDPSLAASPPSAATRPFHTRVPPPNRPFPALLLLQPQRSSPASQPSLLIPVLFLRTSDPGQSLCIGLTASLSRWTGSSPRASLHVVSTAPGWRTSQLRGVPQEAHSL